MEDRVAGYSNHKVGGQSSPSVLRYLCVCVCASEHLIRTLLIFIFQAIMVIRDIYPER